MAREVCNSVSGVLCDYEEAGEELCKAYDLGEDLEDLLAWLGNINPVKGLNLLHNQVRDFDLRDISHQKPLSVLKAVLEMVVNLAGLSESDWRRLLKKA